MIGVDPAEPIGGYAVSPVQSTVVGLCQRCHLSPSVPEPAHHAGPSETSRLCVIPTTHRARGRSPGRVISPRPKRAPSKRFAHRPSRTEPVSYATSGVGIDVWRYDGPPERVLSPSAAPRAEKSQNTRRLGMRSRHDDPHPARSSTTAVPTRSCPGAIHHAFRAAEVAPSRGSRLVLLGGYCQRAVARETRGHPVVCCKTTGDVLESRPVRVGIRQYRDTGIQTSGTDVLDYDCDVEDARRL